MSFTGGVIRRGIAGHPAGVFAARGGVLRKHSVTDTPGIFTVPPKRTLTMSGGVIRKHAATVSPAIPVQTHTPNFGTARQIERRLDAQVADSGEVALAGTDGHKAEQLLAAAKKQGAAILADVTRQALRRWLAGGSSSRLLLAKSLYTDGERARIAEAIAATNATANLLGRSRIRLRQKRAEELRGAAKFSDEPTAFDVFADSPVVPLAPERALEYFRRLIPTIGVIDPQRFGQAMRREAFTLSADVDANVLSRVQDLIRNVLQTGQEVRATPRAINELLTGAGVSSKNPAYGEMVFRTNMMDALNTGDDEERQDPDVIETFPVWMYAGIRDGRQRPQHEAHFDKYFPAAASFASVRDSIAGEFSGYNCRCNSVPIDKWEWAKLSEAGVRVEAGWAA